MSLVPMTGDHVRAVARLHAQALHGDFLPSLGEPFLKVFYQTALAQGLAFGFCALEDQRPVGFVIGSLDTSHLFRQVVKSAWLRLGFAALPAVLRNPGLLLKVAETFLYPSREAAVAETAELLVIAVEESQRGRGLGEELVRALNEAFRQAHIPAYKLTVLQANTGANRFYRRLGFCQAGAFRLYGRDWNLYLYTIGDKPA